MPLSNLKDDLAKLIVCIQGTNRVRGCYIRADCTNEQISLSGHAAETHLCAFRGNHTHKLYASHGNRVEHFMGVNQIKFHRDEENNLNLSYSLARNSVFQEDSTHQVYQELNFIKTDLSHLDDQQFLSRFIEDIPLKSKKRDDIILFLFSVLDKMAATKAFDEGQPCQNFCDIILPNKAIHCLHLSALSYFVLSLKGVKARLCTGLGYNCCILNSDISVNYFSDSTIGFGDVGHAWIEFSPEGCEPFIFDPTMYFSKIRRMKENSVLGISLRKHKGTIKQFHLEGTYHHLLYEKALISQKKGNMEVTRPKKTLLMFSGGYDSTAALYHLLTTTNDTLFVHRIKLKNEKERSSAEQIAADRVIAYCQRHYRPFNYRESEFSLNSSSNYGFDDIYNVVYIAAQLVKYDNSGAAYDNAYCAGLNLEEEDYYFAGAKRREREANELFYYLLNIGEPSNPSVGHTKLDIVYWRNKNKSDILSLLPTKLKALAWTCRNPVHKNGLPMECKKCPSCLHLQDIDTDTLNTHCQET